MYVWKEVKGGVGIIRIRENERRLCVYACVKVRSLTIQSWSAPVNGKENERKEKRNEMFEKVKDSSTHHR